MKTITEMQAQIKEMSSKLDEFAKELSDYKQSENQSTTIDFKQIKAIGIRSPITEHILEKADENVKKKYITMLIAIAYMAKENQENAWLLIQRIAVGVNFNEELIDLNVDAINITDAQIDEFTLDIANAKLTNVFVLDAMLIYLSCENVNDKMLEFLSALFELVKCGKKEVQELSELAKSIACEDNGIYGQLVIKNLNITLKDFVCYTKPYVFGVLYNQNNYIHLIGKSKNLSDELYKLVTENKAIEKIIFSDFCFNINEPLRFEKLSIEFNNCQFKESSASLYFTNCNDIVFTKCKAENISDRVAELKSVNSLKILDCKFVNCGHTGNRDEYGGLFILGDLQSLIIKSSIFSNCYIARESYKYNYYATGVIGYSPSNNIKNVIISDCHFENNKCIQNGSIQENLFYNIDCSEKTIENNIITGKVQKLIY